MITSKLISLFDASKISKAELARKCGVSRPTIDNALAGGNTQVDTLEALARVFKVPVGYFFDDETTSIKNKVTQKGDHSVMIGNNNGTITQLENCAKEVEHLKEIIAEKERSIADKERLINVLMDKNKD